jgi:hypothetical protein
MFFNLPFHPSRLASFKKILAASPLHKISYEE